ncbi:MAG: signal peptidase I [Oscillospiraceae bacterium]|nr:signal peptidase I [Oscillospiraceae bacterium]
MTVKTLEELNIEFAREITAQKQDAEFENESLLGAVFPSPESLKYGPLRESRQNLPPERSLLRDFVPLAVKIAAIAGAALLIFTFVYGLHYNVEPGMSPAIKDGDLVMYYRLDKNYKIGDLTLLTFQGRRQVRRVVAAAGDTVDITEEGLIINGAFQQEPEIYRKTERYAEGISFPVTLGENEVFVLGDARENAADSRVYGAVNIKDTGGAVITVIKRRSL